uniref:Histidine kinase n=1 Tax=Magnetospirillum gryphiswaldense TaxID=55518 RepID=A4TTM5_9PROT|nr:hypothetical protein MGR_1880 [Magnetospirillum gryphiswaldense MSR-1]
MFKSFLRTIHDGHDGAVDGLSLVRLFGELHGGTVDLDSVPGHGTTVTVLLPSGAEGINARNCRCKGYAAFAVARICPPWITCLRSTFYRLRPALFRAVSAGLGPARLVLSDSYCSIGGCESRQYFCTDCRRPHLGGRINLTKVHMAADSRPS